jgi:hypothetical protein
MTPKEKQMAEKKKKIVRVYYALQRKYGFEVPVRDKEGNPIPSKDHQGNQRYSNAGEPLFQEVHRTFLPYIDSPAKGYVSRFECEGELDDKGEFAPSDPNEYAALEAMADDEATKVMREADYEQSVNPTAAALKQQLEKRDREIEALKVKSEKAGTLESQVKELESQIESLTKPDVKGPSKGK